MAREFAVVSGASSSALNDAIKTAFANKNQPCRVISFACKSDGSEFYALVEYNS